MYVQRATDSIVHIVNANVYRFVLYAFENQANKLKYKLV